MSNGFPSPSRWPFASTLPHRFAVSSAFVVVLPLLGWTVFGMLQNREPLSYSSEALVQWLRVPGTGNPGTPQDLTDHHPEELDLGGAWKDSLVNELAPYAVRVQVRQVSGGDMILMRATASNPGVAREATQSLVTSYREVLRSRYQANIEDWRTALEKQVGLLRKSYESALEAEKAAEENLTKVHQKLGNVDCVTPDESFIESLSQLVRARSVAEGKLRSVVVQLELLRSASGSNPEVLLVHQEATLPTRPESSPFQPWRGALAGCLLALALAIAWARLCHHRATVPR